jgi:hypothetical protein
MKLASVSSGHKGEELFSKTYAFIEYAMRDLYDDSSIAPEPIIERVRRDWADYFGTLTTAQQQLIISDFEETLDEFFIKVVYMQERAVEEHDKEAARLLALGSLYQNAGAQRDTETSVRNSETLGNTDRTLRALNTGRHEKPVDDLERDAAIAEEARAKLGSTDETLETINKSVKKTKVVKTY